MSPLKVTIIIALGTSLSIHAAQPQTATWQKADGPYGGPVGPVAVDTNDYIFAATNGVGIHRSTDNGSTWSLMNNGLTNMSISSLGVSSISILFAGTGGGIFLTTNRGETWRPSNLGLSSLSIGPMAFDSSNRIYAATGSGVYISSDSGNSWSQTGFTSSDVRSVATNSSGHIFLGQLYGGIWRSTNRGSTWQRMGFENPDLHVLSITIDANDNVFAGMGFAWVRRSSDNGATWSEVSTGLVGTYVLSVIAIPGGPLFAGTSPFTEGGVFRSIDGGSTWLPTGFTPPTKYADFGFFAFNSQRRVIVSTNVYGLFQTDSNGSWAQGRLTIGSINSLVPNSRGDLFAHTSFGIHRSSNLGNSWDIVRGATTGSYTTALAVGGE